MTIRSKTLYIALHGTIFKVFPDNTVIHNNDNIRSAHISKKKRGYTSDFECERPFYRVLDVLYKDGSRYRADLERLVLLRTMKVTAEKSDDL